MRLQMHVCGWSSQASTSSPLAKYLSITSWLFGAHTVYTNTHTHTTHTNGSHMEPTTVWLCVCVYSFLETIIHHLHINVDSVCLLACVYVARLVRMLAANVFGWLLRLASSGTCSWHGKAQDARVPLPLLLLPRATECYCQAQGETTTYIKVSSLRS